MGSKRQASCCLGVAFSIPMMQVKVVRDTKMRLIWKFCKVGNFFRSFHICTLIYASSVDLVSDEWNRIMDPVLEKYPWQTIYDMHEPDWKVFLLCLPLN